MLFATTVTAVLSALLRLTGAVWRRARFRVKRERRIGGCAKTAQQRFSR